MQNFQDSFEILKQSFTNVFSIWMTVKSIEKQSYMVELKRADLFESLIKFSCIHLISDWKCFNNVGMCEMYRCLWKLNKLYFFMYKTKRGMNNVVKTFRKNRTSQEHFQSETLKKQKA